MFGRKKRTVKEEVAKELSDRLGISEEEALKTLNEILNRTNIFNSKFIDMLATNEKFINALCKNEKLIDALAKKLDFNLTRRLIIASGIIGGLTLGAGTAGAKLVLTDKFVELDGQKFYPASVGVYDAIVLKDDTYVWAEDRFGKVIAEGEAGVDDAEVIQSAIDYGDHIFIKQNIYKCNTTLNIRNGVSIKGEGSGNIWVNPKTILDFSDAGDIPAIKFEDPKGRVQGCSLENLIIKGNENGNKQGIALYLYKVNNAILRDIEIMYFKRALYVYAGWECYYENIGITNCGDINTNTSAILLDAGLTTETETNHQIFIGLRGGCCEYIVFETNGDCKRNHIVAPSIEVPKDGITKIFVFNDRAQFRLTNIDLLARGDVGIQCEWGSFIKIVGGKIDCNTGNYGIYNKSPNTTICGVDIYNPGIAGIYNDVGGGMSVFGGVIYGSDYAERGVYNRGELYLYGVHITYFNKECVLSFKGKIEIYGGKIEKGYREIDGGAIIKLDSVDYALIKGCVVYADPNDYPSYAFEVRDCKNVIIEEPFVYGNIKDFIFTPTSNTNLVIKVRNTNLKTYNSGVVYITGDGTNTQFTVDITHNLIKDTVVAKITLDREGSIDKIYLVDKDGDSFKETIRVQVTFATAPADGESVPIYWYAEVV